MCVTLNPLFLAITRLLQFLTLSKLFPATIFIYSLLMSHYCLLFWLLSFWPPGLSLTHGKSSHNCFRKQHLLVCGNWGGKRDERWRSKQNTFWRGLENLLEARGRLRVEHDCLPLKKQKSFPLAGRNPSDILALQAMFRAQRELRCFSLNTGKKLKVNSHEHAAMDNQQYSSKWFFCGCNIIKQPWKASQYGHDFTLKFLCFYKKKTKVRIQITKRQGTSLNVEKSYRIFATKPSPKLATEPDMKTKVKKAPIPLISLGQAHCIQIKNFAFLP